MNGIKKAAALTALLDVCQDYELKSSKQGHTLIVRLGEHVYKAEKKFLYDFPYELGMFMTNLPKKVKEKYLVCK